MFRRHRGRFGNCDVVVVVRNFSADAGFHQVCDEILRLVLRLRNTDPDKVL